jgi:hypothetical protein
MHCFAGLKQGKVQIMKQELKLNSRGVGAALTLMLLVLTAAAVPAEPAPAAVAGFNAYVTRVEAGLADRHSSADAFLAPVDWSRLHKGEVIIDQLNPGTELPGAVLNDWRGAAFVPGASGADFERVMRDFGSYPQIYSPQVLTARVLAHDGDRYQVTMRVRQKHVITVVMDTAYDVTFGRLDEKHGQSVSHSTSIAEIDAPGTGHERALAASEDHGLLWRMNTYWSYEERDGGLYIQIESVALSRSVPAGLGWAVDPFIQSIPRDSLEFTLRATCTALRR